MRTIEIIEASGRSNCTSCNKRIKKGEKAVKEHLGNGKYPTQQHLSCFKDDNWKFIHDLYGSLTEAERQDLNQS